MVKRTATIAVLLAALASTIACAHTLRVRGNCIVLDGKRGAVFFRGSGDLDRDGRREMVFSTRFPANWYSTILVARRTCSGWTCIAKEEGGYDQRVSVTDVNGDGRLEIIERGVSGDGHGICCIYVLRGKRLAMIGHFAQTRFRDLDGDHVPEVLSVGWTCFGFVGDHWLTIHKWNGHGYTDVSRRFSRQYDAVIRDLRREIHLLRYTHAHGSRSDPASAPELFACMYDYLGQAYEYGGLPDRARAQYAIAYRLQPEDEGIAARFRKAWNKKPPPAAPAE